MTTTAPIPRATNRFRAALGGAGLAALVSIAGAALQDLGRCRAAERFAVEQGMTAISSPDTIDDWRTRKNVPGCRVTAAGVGVTVRGLGELATLFYDRLRSAGWIRTPDPRDAPNEASLRFRRDGTDCLFNFYSGTTLATAEEIEVNSAVLPGPGEERYNLLVLCMPAMDAAPRPSEPSSPRRDPPRRPS